MELIEREALRDDLLYALCGTGYQSRALDCVDMAPVIDAAPVVHGKWISPDTLDCHCSVCGEQPECEQGESVPLYDYCPNCGARMDGGEDHG